MTVNRLVLGNEAQMAVDAGVLPGRAAEGEGLAGGRRQQPGHEPEERGLAGAVGSQEAGHARPEGTADLRDSHLLTEPLGQVVGDHGGVGHVQGVRHASLR